MTFESDKKIWQTRKWLMIAIAVCVLVAGCAVVSLIFLSAAETVPEQPHYLPPVIYGVKEQIEVFENENVEAALLDGVTARGDSDREGQTFQVLVTVYDAGGNEIADFLPGTYQVIYRCVDEESGDAQPVESILIVKQVDTEAPVITGARDLTVTVGGTISYREGVTVTDNIDERVQLQINASAVDLTQPGVYPVIYSASDAWGNETSVTIMVTVEEAVVEDDGGQEDDGTSSGTNTNTESNGSSAIKNVTLEEVYALADKILSKITTPGMSQLQKARAIFDYVHTHIIYVGTSDKSSWVSAAYIGFTWGRGDCFNYFACSKALLTRAGIPNVDLQRVGGTSRHYWQLIDVGDGYYHFDATPHSVAFPLDSFMLTEAEARAYTALRTDRPNYYVYDYASCPVTVVGTPVDPDAPEPTEPPIEEPEPTEPPIEEPEPTEPPIEEPEPTEPPVEEPDSGPTEPNPDVPGPGDEAGT